MTTVILGASTNPARVSYEAARRFSVNDMDFIPVGIKKGKIFGKEILDLRSKPQLDQVDTITLYIGPANQKEWYDYILSLEPRRIIFNPGTENPELNQLARDQGIMTEESCTLVLMAIGEYAN